MLLLGVSSCGTAPPDAELQDHKALWTAREPHTYVIETCWTGFRRGCTTDVVEAGSVTATRTLDAGIWTESAREAEPVAAMFGEVENPGNCSITTVAWNDDWGFVDAYHADCGQEGWGREVRCFEPDTRDPSMCK